MKVICPVCDSHFNIDDEIEIDEVIACGDCASRLVVEEIKDGKVILKEAPVVEEDWGE